MAISYHLETSDLASHSKFFPATIRVPHHQLRNFISTVYENKIYFVHDFDICVLDLQTNQRSLVATVPFEARCLAAAHGWICVGGETKGDCAFLEIGHNATEGAMFGRELIVKMLGKEIVNSMTIHKMAARRSKQQNEIVVLISNNDKTVTLYSLTHRRVLKVLQHPVAMNYASMSPDSTIIVAVGDSNEVFFYKRKDLSEDVKHSFKSDDSVDCDWQRLATPKVPSGDGVPEDYSFAIAFSSNGDLCAVSAQGGYITVLDMNMLISGTTTDGDAIICSFKSSRPSLWGCVRSLSFSPEPWDLLAWTEDHGRAGIADVRQFFARRQCISLDRRASSSVNIKDATPAEYNNLDVRDRLKQQHLQRLRTLRGLLPTGARSIDGARSSPVEQESILYDQSMDLDLGERSILSALGTTIDDMDTQVPRPYSINYNPSPTIQLPSTMASPQHYDIQLLNPDTQMHTDTSVPRRRNSIVLSEPTISRHLMPADSLRSYLTESPAALSEDSSTPPMSTNDLTPSGNPSLSQPMPYNVPPSDPWHVIEAALGRDRQSPTARQSGTLNQVEFAIAAERRLANRLERQLADERRLAARLRTEIEDHERLSVEDQQRVPAEDSVENRLSPSLDRVLQRQLQIEQESGRQRCNELESEIRIHGRRVERLLAARGLLTDRLSQSGETNPYSSTTLSDVSTTITTSADVRELEVTLRQLEEDRRTRRQRIQDLETECRRAESRIELASVHTTTERAEQRERQEERLLDARFLHSARVDSSGAGTAWQLRNHSTVESTTSPSSFATHLRSQLQSQTALNRIRAAASRRTETGSGMERATRYRSTDLPGRLPEPDIQHTRVMLSRHSVDGNGNWIATNDYRRLFATSGRTSTSPSLLARGEGGDRSLEELMRDESLGTAGIGWSPDGKFLYVGTEAGIFEFKVHTKDRMCFPSIEFR